mgnify:CR=1 FL=1
MNSKQRRVESRRLLRVIENHVREEGERLGLTYEQAKGAALDWQKISWVFPRLRTCRPK